MGPIFCARVLIIETDGGAATVPGIVVAAAPPLNLNKVEFDGLIVDVFRSKPLV